jgi:hypothetical protein
MPERSRDPPQAFAPLRRKRRRHAVKRSAHFITAFARCGSLTTILVPDKSWQMLVIPVVRF